jgi:DNA-3-methyladenine glycosylase I
MQPLDTRPRCSWAAREPNLSYHDREWGTPLHDDRLWFEFLILEGAPAGLSWETILNKRDISRAAFDNFEPNRVAAYGPDKVAELLGNAGIIRNKLKVAAAIRNAHGFLAIQREFGTFDRYAWAFVGGQTRQNAWASLKEIPAKTPESEDMSKDLLKRGFKFVGPTICYAFMQATGMVNDHTTDCFRYAELR